MSLVIPAHELKAHARGRRNLIGVHGTLGAAILPGNGLPIHGIGAASSRQEGHSCFYISHQRHIGYGDRCGSAGPVRLDINLDTFLRSKLFGEIAAFGDLVTVYLNGAATRHNGIVKRECRFRCFIVGDGQRRVF